MATRFWISLLTILFGATLWADNAASTPVERVKINNAVWYYKPEQTFKRIGEYFDGIERTGRKIIIRTQDEPREGLYFIVRLNEYADELPRGCAFAVDLLRHDGKEPETTIFNFPENPTPHREFWLGYTGESEPPEESAPVAWQVRLLNPEGETIARLPSFLWEKPATDQADEG
ncbi:MAG: hypothetical protein ACQKBV_00470 [Puniceicoccales bacterium]